MRNRNQFCLYHDPLGLLVILVCKCVLNIDTKKDNKKIITFSSRICNTNIRILIISVFRNVNCEKLSDLSNYVYPSLSELIEPCGNSLHFYEIQRKASKRVFFRIWILDCTF